jgi:hypothetical protein
VDKKFMDMIESTKPPAENQNTPEPPGHSMFNVRCSMFDVPRLSAMLFRVKNVFDYLGGSREEPPEGLPLLASPWWLGLWWGLMIGLILLFCGQTSKFIYIDF